MTTKTKTKCPKCGRVCYGKMIRCPGCGATLDGSPDAAERLGWIVKKKLYKAVKILPFTSMNIIRCPQCGYEGESQTITKGTLGVEVALWLLFIFPGLIYSVWRFSSRYEGCPDCSWEHVVQVS